MVWLATTLYAYEGLLFIRHCMNLKPAPEFLLEDYGYYADAYNRWCMGENPYADQRIGTAFLYPPQALFLVALLEWCPSPETRFALFVTVSLVLVAAMLLMLSQHTGVSVSSVPWVVPIAFGFGPLLFSTYMGQINIIVAFFICVVIVQRKDHPFIAGVVLSAAIVIKLTPVFLLFLFADRWWKRSMSGVLVGIVCSSLATGFVYGWTVWPRYFEILNVLTEAFPLGSGKYTMVNVFYLGFTSLGWDFSSVAPMVQRAYVVIMVLLFSLATRLNCRSKTGDPLVAVLVFGMTILPNIVWYHHFVLFLPVIILLALRSPLTPGRAWRIVVLLAIVQCLPLLVPMNYGALVLQGTVLLIIGMSVGEMWFRDPSSRASQTTTSARSSCE
ncbi:MAG: DUF2029 domain-containing protein [Planctomycetes bacterium]|nr:DUF2029 domain-containing protein [Planctomycetota bacterium]